MPEVIAAAQELAEGGLGLRRHLPDLAGPRLPRTPGPTGPGRRRRRRSLMSSSRPTGPRRSSRVLDGHPHTLSFLSAVSVRPDRRAWRHGLRPVRRRRRTSTATSASTPTRSSAPPSTFWRQPHDRSDDAPALGLDGGGHDPHLAETGRRERRRRRRISSRSRPTRRPSPSRRGRRALRIVVGEGSTVAVGEVIARVGPASAMGEAAKPIPTAREADEDETPATAAAADVRHAAARVAPRSKRRLRRRTPTGAAQTSDAPAMATPLARRVARAHGVELDALKGSGPRGRITRTDVSPAAGIATPRGAGPGRRGADRGACRWGGGTGQWSGRPSSRSGSRAGSSG